MNKPNNIDYNELIKTTTVFFVDENYEKILTDEIHENAKHFREKMTQVHSLQGLKEYIVDEENSLENLLSLINISTEKFKRLITKIRLDKGMIFNTEWSLKQTRKIMMNRSDIMDEICELLLNGANNDRYKGLIPEFIRKNFCIDIDTVARLANVDYLNALVKKGMDGKYNNGIGDHVFSIVEERVKEICDREGLTYSRKKNVPLMNRVIGISIPNEIDPKILIDITFNITTSSAQTKYKEKELANAKIIKNLKNSRGKNVVLVNFLDGAGWVARQSDLRDIYRCSQYSINLNSLHSIENIIKYYMD